MTAAARISQADMDRAVKVAARHGNARVVFDLVNCRIEVIIGESGGTSPREVNEWDRE